MKGFTGRSIKRDKARLRAQIACMGQSSHGYILDLNEKGICIYTSTDIPVRSGDKITISTEEMGLLTATVRWFRRPKIGAELVLSSNTRAKVESYYKLFRDGRQPA